MNASSSFSTAADASSTGPSPDRPEVYARIAGETDAERIEQHIRTLRRFTEFALREAERLDRQAEDLVARKQAAPVEGASPPAAAAPASGETLDGETPDGGPPDAGEPAGEVSLALHRLARMARLNIALEQKLVEDLRYPGQGAAGKREQRKRAEHAAQLAAKRAECESFVEENAATDKQLERERFEELMRELREGLDAGTFDEDLGKLHPKAVGWHFMTRQDVHPNWFTFFEEEPAAAGPAEPDEAGIAPASGARDKEVPAAVAPDPIGSGTDPPL